MSFVALTRTDDHVRARMTKRTSKSTNLSIALALEMNARCNAHSLLYRVNFESFYGNGASITSSNLLWFNTQIILRLKRGLSDLLLCYKYRVLNLRWSCCEYMLVWKI